MAKQAMTGHHKNILKRTVERLMDTLSQRERYIVANDPDSELAKWFNKTATSEARSKYESPTYWRNEPSTFQYPEYEPEFAD